MIEIGFLGTGGAVATAERDNMSFIISRGKNLVLVDCGGCVFPKIKKLGYNPKNVDAIIITHIHPDHVYGLPSFIHSLYLDDCVISLYGSEQTVTFCRGLLDYFHLLDEKIKCRVRFNRITPGSQFSPGEGLACVPLEIPHHSSSLALHFHFQEEKKRFIYSGDTPAWPALFKEAAGIDYLMHDCSAPSRFFNEYPSLNQMHTNSLDLGRLTAEAHIKNLIPCHFFGELDYSISEIEQEIRQSFKGKLIIPEDLQKIRL